MNKTLIVRVILFVLVWANAFLAAHHLKQLPAVDQTQVSLWVACVISAYEWIERAIKWMKVNWFTAKHPKFTEEDIQQMIQEALKAAQTQITQIESAVKAPLNEVPADQPGTVVGHEDPGQK